MEVDRNASNLLRITLLISMIFGVILTSAVLCITAILCVMSIATSPPEAMGTVVGTLSITIALGLFVITSSSILALKVYRTRNSERKALLLTILVLLSYLTPAAYYIWFVGIKF